MSDCDGKCGGECDMCATSGFEERSDYPEWKARQDWYDSSMIGQMLNSLWDSIHAKSWHPTDEESDLFWRWFDDVDMQSGMFGK